MCDCIVSWNFRYWHSCHCIGRPFFFLHVGNKQRSRALLVHSFSCSRYNFFLLFSISLPLNCEVIIGAVTREFWQMTHHLTKPKKEVTHFSWVKGLKNSCMCLSGKFVVWCYMEININGKCIYNQYLSNKYEQKVSYHSFFLMQLNYVKAAFSYYWAKLNALYW